MALAGQLSNHIPALERAVESIAAKPVRRKHLPLQRQQQSRLNPADVAHLLAEYDERVEINDLAKLFGVSRSTVFAILDRAGVRRRHPGFSPGQLQQAIELYKSGLSLVEVGKVMGVNRSTVDYHFRQADVQLRPRPGWQY